MKRRGGLERVLIMGSMMVVAWFYLWTVSPTGPGTLVDAADGSYYNLLARGLLKGQLSLDMEADPALAEMADPYNPTARGPHGLHDASYYKGKYYIYFGITPVLLLYLPFHVLTGSYLTDHAAVMIFALLGFLTAWAIVRSFIRVYFPTTSLAVKLACLWALALANMVPPLLRRPGMWEVPIACAYALFMLALYFVWRALHGNARYRWLVIASLVMGLCVGARPTYLAGSVVLLAPIAALTLTLGGHCWRRREWWGMVVATILPIALIGAGLALYNFLRFENPLEFGQTYQLAGDDVSKMRLFSAAYVPVNLLIYLFSTPGFSPYFPFLTVIDPPIGPEGHLGVENPYGIIPGMPWVLLALAGAWSMVRRGGEAGWWYGTTLAGSLMVFATVCGFAGNTGRYEVDFTPGLTLLGAVGALWLSNTTGTNWARRLRLIGIVGLAAWSGAFNFFISLQHNRLFQANYPEQYFRVAHFFNHVPHWLAKLTNHRDGPVELKVVFPTDKYGAIQPLVATGHQFLADYLFVHYLDAGLLRFGLEHTSRGTWTGPETRIDPEAEHTVVVQMGSLYPPGPHPVHAGLSSQERDLRLRTVKVLLNGRTVLHVVVDCYDASDWQPSIGTSGTNRPGFKEDFSGQIRGWRRIAPLEPDFTEQQTGILHLLLRLPAFTGPRSEPLLSTGEPGRGDLIYIRYIDPHHYQIGHDRWGYGGSLSPVISYDPNVPIDLDISCPPLTGDAEMRLVINLNGHPIIDVDEPFHPSRPTQIAVGWNQIGASTAEERFTGVIEIQERVAQ